MEQSNALIVVKPFRLGKQFQKEIREYEKEVKI